MDDERSFNLWEERYRRGLLGAEYPFDIVVSFVFSRFQHQEDGSQKRVLDFGCGAGNHIQLLLDAGFDVYAVDTAETAIERVRALMKAKGNQWLETHLVRNIGQVLPFDSKMFDFVLDRSSLGQNRAEDIPAIVAEIHRVLKTGGVYFGVNFSDHHPSVQYGRRLGGGDFADFSGGKFQGLGGRHFFSVSEIYDLFSKFEIEDITFIEHRSMLGSGGSSEYSVTATKQR